jgi:hypothetical protein
MYLFLYPSSSSYPDNSYITILTIYALKDKSPCNGQAFDDMRSVLPRKRDCAEQLGGYSVI